MGSARLTDSMLDGASDVYFSEAFHSMMEHHILDLIASDGAQSLAVENSRANQYHGDLYGLLISLAVPLQYHWITMRCNNMRGPHEYRRDMVHLIQPSFGEIDELLAIYRTSTTST